ncbi:MAG: hypothetical protein QOI04_484 [Verrucomicrobiota bacterium]
MVLIFFGTLDQVHLGIHAAQAKYFRSLVVLWQPAGSAWRVPIFPGGYLIGTLLFLNLMAAHGTRFQLVRKKIGIFIIHAGVVVLLLGELFTGLFAKESMMRMDIGAAQTFSEAPRETELAVIDTTSKDDDLVVALPESLLARGGVIQPPALPFTLRIAKFMANTSLSMRSPSSNAPRSLATIGIGPNVVATEIPRTVKQDERDLTTVFVKIDIPKGTLGTWMVSNALGAPQSFQYEGHTYELRMRQKRYYKPFTIKLLDFRHDVYPGTDIPKNFSSRVRLIDSRQKEDRDVLIYMNSPLRYSGYTFYQAGFDNNDKTSILQVVKNPTFVLPYIACGLVGAGLLSQFSMHLFGFLRRRRA